MNKTALATVLFLGALPAVTACSGAPGDSTDPTSNTTSAATAVQQATISGPIGTWSTRLHNDAINGTLLPSVEIDFASPRWSYVASDAYVTSYQLSSTTETFTLTFKSVRLTSAPAGSNATSTWVTIANVGSFPVDSVHFF